MLCGFDTLQIHAGAQPDPATGARQTPIYQNTAYVFRDADHAAALFNLQEVGYIYSRLTNPTVMTLAERLAALEGGIGAVCTSSGHAAQIMALFPLMRPGDNIISSTRLYGGTVTQFTHTIRRFGWSAAFVDTEDLAAVEVRRRRPHPRDLLRVDRQPRRLRHRHPRARRGRQAPRRAADRRQHLGDRPTSAARSSMGADLVVLSTTKYLTGNGTVVGGAIVDSGKFDWSASGKFPSLTEPEPAYHGLKFHETFGPMAYTFHSASPSACATSA